MKKPFWGHCKESFAPIPGTSGKYEVSSLGRVLSVRSRLLLRQFTSKKGFLTVCLPGPSPTAVHRLVAEMFALKPPGSAYVHHLNGCKLDNRAVNLVWSASKSPPVRTEREQPPEPFVNLTEQEALTLRDHPSLRGKIGDDLLAAIKDMMSIVSVPAHVLYDNQRGFLWSGVTSFDRVMA